MYRVIAKPFFDFFAALFLLILFTPVILLVFLVLAIQNGGKVFFIQKRPGYKGKPFNIIKFKTMRDAFDPDGNPLPDALRITKTGRFIRKYSLDELLQLVNVLKGEMSVVGPRPLLMKYLPIYTAMQSKRHDVLPGITGLAQVKGRNNISWEKKFEHDIEYTITQSFSLDCKILLLTVLKVFSGADVTQEGSETTAEFTGPLSSQ